MSTDLKHKDRGVLQNLYLQRGVLLMFEKKKAMVEKGGRKGIHIEHCKDHSI